ncbi:MAG: carbohydrate kinase [Clostridia bacterium]|nr:carbohydrate kinase [Clostridia bacterium]
MKILAIGEIIFDIFNGEAEIGGAPLNFCAHCAALGAESSLISAVGGDELATAALEKLNEFGVGTAYVQKNDCVTGQCLVTVKDGHPEYNVLRPAAYDKITAAENSYNADVFAFGTLIQRDEVSRRAVKNILKKGDFKEIFCDINLRPDCYDEDSCRLCLENATILKISDEEEPLLRKFGLYNVKSSETETVKSICERFGSIRLVLYTKGARGSLIYDKPSDIFYDIPAVEAKVVSTVGAGDSYSAAFLCEYLKSKDITAAGNAGAKLSAFVVAHRGAVPKE